MLQLATAKAVLTANVHSQLQSISLLQSKTRDQRCKLAAFKEVRAWAPLRRSAMRKLRTGRDSGGDETHAAASPRPPISFYTMVPRTGGYAHDVGVWDLSIVAKEHFVPNPRASVTIRSFCIAVRDWPSLTSLAVRRHRWARGRWRHWRSWG